MRTSWVAAAVVLGALTLPLNGQRIAPKLDNVSVPPGYFLDLLVTGLDFPTAITFSPGAAYVAESGAVPGFTPKVKTVNAQGQVSIVLSADQLGASQLLPPLTDITYHSGWLYITHRQVGANGWTIGAVSRFNPSDPVGTFQTLLTNLPSSGDHHTDEIAFDTAGRAYFSVGTATNSSVVGPDNSFITGAVRRHVQR
jgi:glucose/arabinose dehydrogenase